MSNRRSLLIFASLLAAATNLAAQSNQKSARGPFIGAWKLISCEQKSNSGQISYPYGDRPVGRITYDRAGRMSAQLMRPGRSDRNDPGFASYFGAFDVDEDAKTVIHHVHASMRPTAVGTDLKRTYQFSGKRLTLTAASDTGVTKLVWEREPD